MSQAKSYDPNRMLNAVMDRLQLKSDAALGRLLDIQAPVISKIRHQRMPVSGAVLVRLHEATGLSVRALQDSMGTVARSFAYLPPKGDKAELLRRKTQAK